MWNEDLTVLVIGCGSIGTRHISHLLSLPNVTVLAQDVDADRAADVAEVSDIWTTTSLSEALDRDPDAALVCTPTATHIDIATQVIENGTDVFIEKPISDDLTDVQEFLDRADELDRVVMAGCNMRFHPPVRQLEDWITDGEIGEVKFVRLRYANRLDNWRDEDYRETYSAKAEQGGGIILDCIHEIDLAARWLGDVSSLYCSADKLSDLDINVNDTAEIIFENDRSMGEVHVDSIRPYRTRMYEVVGTDGIVRWEGNGKDPERSTISKYDVATDSWERTETTSEFEAEYRDELKHFLSCVDDRSDPMMNGEDGKRILELAAAARESARTGSRQDVSTN